MRILLFIGHLDQGGSQRQIAELARGLAQQRHSVCMATILPRGQFESILEGLPSLELVSLYPEKSTSSLGTARRLVGAVRRLRRLIRRYRPDVVYSSLYISNLVAYGALMGYGALRGSSIPLAWSIRSSNEELSRARKIALALSRRLASRLPAVVYNSWAGKQWHEDRGFPSKPSRVIPNGIDTESFRKQPEAGSQCRRDWGIPDGSCLIGLVARLSPMKDHETFLEAAELVAAQRPQTYFVCVGDGPLATLQRLQSEAKRRGLGDRLLWTGRQTDMVAAYSALDILVSSSAWGEGFSNAIGEAMACSLPCVATAAGDAGKVLGDTGILVDPGKPSDLAQGILTLVDETQEQRQHRSRSARQRVVTEFSMGTMIDESFELLAGLTNRDEGSPVH